MSLLALFTAVALATEQPPAVRLGEPALLFSLPAINEKVAMKTVSKPGVALSDFIGVEPSRPSRAVVLFFFEGKADANYLPGLNKVQRRYQRRGVQILAISTDTVDLAEQSEWIEHMNLQFPVLRDNHGVVSARYAIDRLPLIMVLDQHGFVFAIGRPDADDPDSLVAELTPLIGSNWEAQQE